MSVLYMKYGSAQQIKKSSIPSQYSNNYNNYMSSKNSSMRISQNDIKKYEKFNKDLSIVKTENSIPD